jgi:adenylate kinase family enzyme
MQRVMILGCAGTGKSTLARALGLRLGLPVVHLDTLYWRPGWVEPEAESFRSKVVEATAGDRWITDGNFAGHTFDLILPRADTVLFVSQPRWLCFARVILRMLRDRGKRRPDLAEGCFERLGWRDRDFLMWMWNFERVSRPRIEALLAGCAAPVTRLDGDRAIARFLVLAGPGATKPRFAG